MGGFLVVVVRLRVKEGVLRRHVVQMYGGSRGMIGGFMLGNIDGELKVVERSAVGMFGLPS